MATEYLYKNALSLPLIVVHTVSHLVNCMRFRLNFTDAIEGINAGKSKEGTTLWWFLSECKCWNHSMLFVVVLSVLIFTFKASHYRVTSIAQLYKIQYVELFLFFSIVPGYTGLIMLTCLLIIVSPPFHFPFNCIV